MRSSHDLAFSFCSESCAVRPNNPHELALGPVRQSSRTINGIIFKSYFLFYFLKFTSEMLFVKVTSGTGGATVQFKPYSNPSSASLSRIQDRRYIWNPTVNDSDGNTGLDQSIERTRRKRKHEYVVSETMD
jgi:hypothetical protein